MTSRGNVFAVALVALVALVAYLAFDANGLKRVERVIGLTDKKMLFCKISIMEIDFIGNTARFIGFENMGTIPVSISDDEIDIKYRAGTDGNGFEEWKINRVTGEFEWHGFLPVPGESPLDKTDSGMCEPYKRKL